MDPPQKDTQTEDANWPENVRQCANIFICMLPAVVLSIFLQKKHFFASNLSSSGCSHIGPKFTNKEQTKKLTCDIIDTCATPDGLVHDVKITDRQTQKWQWSWPHFSNFQMSITEMAVLTTTFLQLSNVDYRGYTSGGVYRLCIYPYARLQLLSANQDFAVVFECHFLSTN